jgi:hypothetical protein
MRSFASVLAACLVAVIACAGCRDVCVDCSPPPSGLGEIPATSFKSGFVEPGSVWWAQGSGEAWSMAPGDDDQAEPIALTIVATTPSRTALAVPDDAPRGGSWRLFADGVATPNSAEIPEDPASFTRLPEVPSDRLALSPLEPGTFSVCNSACIIEPFQQVTTTETDTIRWGTTLRFEDRDGVAIDAWFMDEQDAANEASPRVLDTVRLDDVALDNALNPTVIVELDEGTLSLANIDRPIALRLRALADAGVGATVETTFAR